MSRTLEGVWFPSPACSGRSEPELEARPAGNTLTRRDRGAMRSDNLHDNRQSEPCALGSHSLTSPETIEDPWSVLSWYARPTVQNS